MFIDHVPLLIAVIAAILLTSSMAYLGYFLGPRRPTKTKNENFECGNKPSGDARHSINIKYYLVGIIFLVFDIELIFIFPWATTFFATVKEQSLLTPLVVFAAMQSFIIVLVVALIYIWRKGALDWHREQKDDC